MLGIEPNELKLLIADRYTGAEIIERLEIPAEEVLDSFFDTVYNNLYKFDELAQDLGLDSDEDYQNIYDTEEEYP
jgi:ribosome assembly protein YihI (activator of Der GTPase)